MSGEPPAAYVPAAPRPGLLARAEPVSRRQERRLVREVQRGSAAALEELFRREWPRAYRAAYLVVHDAAAAEDIAQEAFLAAVRSIDRFDRRRPFGPWMHRIVVNRAIDATRARTLRREVDAPAADVAEARPDPPSSPLPDDVVIALARAEPGAPRRRGAPLRLRLHARARSLALSTCRAAP